MRSGAPRTAVGGGVRHDEVVGVLASDPDRRRDGRVVYELDPDEQVGANGEREVASDPGGEPRRPRAAFRAWEPPRDPVQLGPRRDTAPRGRGCRWSHRPRTSPRGPQRGAVAKRTRASHTSR